ncbi:MAG: hypothetical protein IJY85_00660 [Ruminococcus sp.]|nr:hypothetical protein [Ruminococcus sp.]
MRKTIDLTYGEISDNQEGKSLLGLSTQTVQKAIKQLEQKYFQGRNIFRNGAIDSDYLFRWEISNLLQVLIWLEATDVFNDKKVKKSGVSSISIEKIINNYESVFKKDTFKWYEKVMLEGSAHSKESKEILEYIQKAYHSMTRFLLLSAIGYKQASSNIFKTIVREFDELTYTLNSYIYITQIPAPHVRISKHGTIYGDSNIEFSLNLKTSIVDTINRIADIIYDFDENGVCKRKKHISDDDATQERYSDICAKHIDYIDENCQKEMDEEEIAANGGIDLVRQELDNFMSDLIKSVLQIETIKEPRESNKGTERILRSCAKHYITRFYLIHMLCKGEINHDQWNFSDSPEKCYEESLRSKTILTTYHHTGFKFKKYLNSLEESVLKRTFPKNHIFDDETFSSEVEAVIIQYANDVKEYKEMRDERLLNLDTILSNEKRVADNIENIKSLNESLLKNILVIILKLEDEDKRKFLLQKYFGEITDLDHTAFSIET